MRRLRTRQYAPTCRGEDGVRAALGQRDHPGLRERRLLTLVHPRPAEERLVHRRVGHIQTRPVDRDQPTPGQPHPDGVDLPARPDRAGHPLEQRRNGSDPNRARAWKIADLLGNAILLLPTRGPRQPIASTAPARPHTNPPSTTPSRSRSTPSPAPATSDAAPRSDPPQRSPHRPEPAGTPASTPRPTPDPTTDDPTPASPTQHAA